ncbi:MAG: HEPN domain-containing protein [Candidatus Edwardsbacteria bacterium]
MNPLHKRRSPVLPEEWLRHAKSDLKLAKLGLNQDILPEQICFHAQQAVEKAIKSVLFFRKIDFPFTHDLEELLDTLENAEISIPSDLLDVSILTPYAVETRYPGYWGEISKNEVAEAVQLAERTIKWAEEFIQKEK